jgi:type II secretion system protein N
MAKTRDLSPTVKWTLFPAWFSLVFFVSVYITFPVHLVKAMVVARGEEELGKDHPTKVGKHGVNPELAIGSISLHRASGLEFERMRVRFASPNPDPGPEILVDELRVRVGLLSVLSDTKTIHFSGRVWDGTFDGHVDVDDKGMLHGIDLDVKGIKLEKSPLLLQKIGAPVTGDVNISIHLALGAEPQKDGTGEIVIDTQKLSLGPGELKVSVFGLQVPLIDMGALTGKIVFDKGKGKSEDLKLVGRDLNAELDTSIELTKKFDASRITGGGSFLAEKAFLEENNKFKAMLEIAPGVDKAKDSEGRVHFLLRGTIKSPQGSLSRSAGADRKAAGSKRGK